MKHIFAIDTPDGLQKYQSFAGKIQSRLEQYLDFLRTEYAVSELPRAIVWTSAETATRLIRDIPVPAYTNEYRTVFCPDLESWRQIYLKQLDGMENEVIRRYYETKISENHILQILGHEFVHHSELFLDGFDSDCESGIWFEEGMCEYISRKYFLTDAEFDEEAKINALLVDLHREKGGKSSLEAFGTSTYSGDYASIFCQYWRSFLAVAEIVRQYEGDLSAVFREYRRWHTEKSEASLSEWFHIHA